MIWLDLDIKVNIVVFSYVTDPAVSGCIILKIAILKFSEYYSIQKKNNDVTGFLGNVDCIYLYAKNIWSWNFTFGNIGIPEHSFAFSEGVDSLLHRIL